MLNLYTYRAIIQHLPKEKTTIAAWIFQIRFRVKKWHVVSSSIPQGQIKRHCEIYEENRFILIADARAAPSESEYFLIGGSTSTAIYTRAS